MASFRTLPGGAPAGIIRVPGDKSISHRSLMLGAIAEGETRVSGFLDGEDCLATLSALEAMGVRVERGDDDTLSIHGVGMQGLRRPAKPLDLGNSGTAMRLFAGLLGGQPFRCVLTGDASLRRRPMGRVIDPLTLMGVEIDSDAGRPPLVVSGRRALAAIDYLLPVASAQVKSAILLAGLYADGYTRVTEPEVTRDHTERMLTAMGADVRRSGAAVHLRGPARLEGIEIPVPGDLSSAAFFLVAGALAASEALTIRNVGINPTRTGVISILRSMGADIVIDDERQSGGEPVADITVRRSALQGIEVDPALVPLAIDEFPVLFVAAACARGDTVFTGIGELRVKESDRIAAMAEGLRALGVEVEETVDSARVRGRERLEGGRVDSHGDHRIAMAFAVAGVAADASVHIVDVANVGTSFPGFPETCRAAGVRIEVLK
ncbi:MAG: 3-phosphoshikimate 1-carboxyvinyltransferase [Gammaproteobacteria bacterium]